MIHFKVLNLLCAFLLKCFLPYFWESVKGFLNKIHDLLAYPRCLHYNLVSQTQLWGGFKVQVYMCMSRVHAKPPSQSMAFFTFLHFYKLKSPWRNPIQIYPEKWNKYLCCKFSISFLFLTWLQNFLFASSFFA